MAGRIVDIDGYGHTPSMRSANMRCRYEFNCGLRDWLFRWRRQNREASVRDLAAFWDVDPKTIYDWLERLNIGTGGVMFIDLEMEPEAARTGTEG